MRNLHPHDVAFSGISRQLDRVFFIQIGAADGRRADPVYSFVNRYQWEGILVEPLPDLYELLKTNYISREGLIFENVAITESNESRTIRRVPLEAVTDKKVPGWAFGISSLVPEKTVFSRGSAPHDVCESLQREMVDETIKCMTFEALLDKHNVTSFDVLQIDTEGYDAKILLQIDLARYRPKLINFEWQWLDDDEKEQVSAYLQSHGYTLYSCGEDMLATLDTLDKYQVDISHTISSTVPVFSANLVGIITNTEINQGDGSCQAFPAQVEFVRAARESRMAVRGDAVLYPLISCIDGKRTVSDISEILHSDEGPVLEWVHRLREYMILE